jgi:hypothetical protein
VKSHDDNQKPHTFGDVQGLVQRTIECWLSREGGQVGVLLYPYGGQKVKCGVVYHCVPKGICDFYQGVQVRILTQAVPGSVWNVQIIKVCPVINAQQVIGHIIGVSVAPDWEQVTMATVIFQT